MESAISDWHCEKFSLKEEIPNLSKWKNDKFFFQRWEWQPPRLNAKIFWIIFIPSKESGCCGRWQYGRCPELFFFSTCPFIFFYNKKTSSFATMTTLKSSLFCWQDDKMVINIHFKRRPVVQLLTREILYGPWLGNIIVEIQSILGQIELLAQHRETQTTQIESESHSFPLRNPRSVFFRNKGSRTGRKVIKIETRIFGNL